MPYEYETNGAAIYEQSFRMIRAESDLTNFNALEEQVAVRMIHAAGLQLLSLILLKVSVENYFRCNLRR